MRGSFHVTGRRCCGILSANDFYHCEIGCDAGWRFGSAESVEGQYERLGGEIEAFDVKTFCGLSRPP